MADQSGCSMETLSLAWLKNQPGVGSVLIGARSEKQLRENVAAFDASVPADVMAEVSRLSDELKPQMGTNPDMWQSESRFY